MDNRRPSRGPGSGRPSSRFNPITGEEIDARPQSQTAAPKSLQINRPESVPPLNLGQLGDDLPRKYAARKHDYQDPPSPSSILSWGTCDTSARSMPSNRKSISVRSQQSPSSVMLPDSVLDTNWVSDPYGQLQQMKTLDAEEHEQIRRKERITETVMVDQLSRAVISAPDQDTVQRHLADSLYHQPGQSRGHIRHLHQSKVKTTGTPTELLLAQRVRFGARILTRNGADAVRELTGFFFGGDNSLTIYEYKQLAVTSKALPFITRGLYQHLTGRRKGMPYTLADIRVGSTLTFSSRNQNALPQTARLEPIVAIRICDVDDAAKHKIILDGVRSSEQADVWNKFHALTPEEHNDLTVLKAVQDKIKSMIKNRSIKTVTGLGAHFRKCDKSGDGVLDRYELESALKEFHINLNSEDFENVWKVVDQNGDGVLDYGEFLRTFIGTMSEFRKLLVRKAFQKLDSSKQGSVTLPQMRIFFNAARHPAVKSGQTSEVALTEQFLSSWTHCSKSGEISYPEFEDYYEGLSIGIESDEEFLNILRNCWGL